MTLPVIGKVFGWVISTRLVKSKSETKSRDPAVPCVISSTVQFVFYCSSFPVCVPECSQWSLWKCLEAPEVGPTSAKNPKSNTATFDQFPPVLDHKSFLDPIPAFVAWIISNHQKKYIFCYSLAECLSVRAVAPVVRESLRAPRATGFGPRDGILGQIETASPMQVFWHHVFLCEIHCTIIIHTLCTEKNK